jgi:hypothetical protein
MVIAPVTQKMKLPILCKQYLRIQFVPQKTQESAKFEVLTSVVMKSTGFWDVTPFSPVEVQDVSKVCSAYIFRVTQYAKHEPVKSTRQVELLLLAQLTLRL